MRIINILTRHSAAALLVMVTGILVACGPGASDKEFIESAKSYMAEKHVSEAAIELKNAEARYLLGEISLQIGDLASAEKAYALQPDSPSIMDTYGWILLENNKTSEAHTMLKQAADMLPDVPELQYHYAKVLFRTGDTTAANRILKPLIATGKAFDGRIDAETMFAQ